MITKGIKPLIGGKRYCIGDIHGRPDKVIALLKKIKFNKKDVLFFIGDYIDRGNDSKGTLDLIMNLETKYRIQPILGNHEWMALMAYFDPKYHKIWKENYGEETLASFNVSSAREIPSKYILWMKNLPKVIKSGNFILSHAGVNFQAKDTFLDTPQNRMDTLFRDDALPDANGKYRAIIGHKTKSLQQCLESSKSPLVYTDAGCGKKDYGKLIAFCLDDDTMYHV